MYKLTTANLKPQVFRKNVVVKNSKIINIVVKPSAAKIIKLGESQDHNRISSKNIVKLAQKQEIIKNAAVIRPTAKTLKSKKRRAKIEHRTRDISSDSVDRIKKIRNYGLGKKLVIVANGPSINKISLELLNGISDIDTLSINSPNKKIWPTTHWSFFDRSQFRRHKDLWDSYDGNIFNSTSIRDLKHKSMQFKNLGGIGFSDDLLKGLYIGHSSTYASMQIALWMAYDHIFIVGCDMNPEGIDGQLHFYGINPDVDASQRQSRFIKESKSYIYASNHLSPEIKRKFTFCTKDINPWPFIHEFNTIDHLNSIEYIINWNRENYEL